MSNYSIHTAPYTTGNITINAAGSGYSGYTYTSASTSATDLVWGNGTWNNVSTPVTISQKATIELKGEDADIVINGESLSETLKGIKEALRIPKRLERDEKLEKEWEELQKAADQYNKLKAEYKEKQRVWNALKEDFDK